MLRLLFGIAKFAFAACVGLAAGNLIEWDGATLSERMRAPYLREWAGKAADKVEDTIRHAASARETPPRRDESHGISASERSRLRALIRDLGENETGN